MKKYRLSIGLIIKNEEKCLERCLLSLQPILDKVSSELVIVDTGSTDKTKSIALKYTEKVFDFIWCDDFSKARNFVLAHCSGEWFMQIDADESFVETKDIISFFTSTECSHYNDASYVVRNYHTYNKEKYTDFYLSRIFRITPDRKYQGIIHEMVPQIGPVKYIDEYVEHYGYVNSFSDNATKRKNRRNLPLLLKEMNKSPDNSRLLYQAVQEYLGMDEVKTAEKLCKKIIYNKNLDKNDIFVTYATLRQIDISASKGNFKEAADIGRYYFKLGMSTVPECLDILDKISSILVSLNEEEEAENYYMAFFKLWEELYKKSIEGQGGIIFKANAFKPEVFENKLYQYAEFLQKHDKYTASITYLFHAKGALGKKKIPEIITLWMNAIEQTTQYDIVEKYYKLAKQENGNKLRLARELLMGIWERNPEMAERVGECFETAANDDCLRAQNVLMMERRQDLGLASQLAELCRSLPIEAFYQKIIFISLENDVDITPYLERCSVSEVNELAIDITKKNPPIRKNLLEGKYTYKYSDFLNTIRFYAKLEEILLFDVDLNPDQLEDIFNKFIKDSYAVAEKMYHPSLLYPEKCEVLPDKDCFVFYCMEALNQKKRGDIKSYIYYMKKSVRYYPEMTSIIKNLTVRLKDTIKYEKKHQDEFDDYSKKVKNVILHLIKSGRTNEAEEIIRAYEEIKPSDPEILLMKQQLFLIK